MLSASPNHCFYSTLQNEMLLYYIYTTMTKLPHAKLSYEKLISKAITVRFEFNLHL